MDNMWYKNKIKNINYIRHGYLFSGMDNVVFVVGVRTGEQASHGVGGHGSEMFGMPKIEERGKEGVYYNETSGCKEKV